MRDVKSVKDLGAGRVRHGCWWWLRVAMSCSWRSVLWLVLLVVACRVGVLWLVVWLVGLVLSMVDLPWPDGMRDVLAWLSPLGDWGAWVDRVQRERGNRMVRRLGFVPVDDARDYRVWWYGRWLTLEVGEGLGRGLAPARLLEAAIDAAPLIDCVDADLRDVHGVCCWLRFHREPRYEALHRPVVVCELPVPNTNGMGLSVRVGRTPDGPFMLRLRNLPGLCVGGASRSGKTRAVRLLASSLLVSGVADVLVVDCKGGNDFLTPLSSTVPSLEGLGATVLRDGGDEFLALVRDRLDGEVKTMRVRQKELSGSYWETDMSVRPRLRMVIVDECQELWAMKGRAKDEAELLRAIQRDLLTLIRVGASAGWLTVLCSQDWTSDVLDTSVRSQLARIAFWSAEPSKTKAILGCSDEALKRMNFQGMDRSDWRGLSIVDVDGQPEWVRWDDLQ